MTTQATIIDSNGKRHKGQIVRREPEEMTLLEAVVGPFFAACAPGVGSMPGHKTTVRDSEGRVWTGFER